MEHALARIGPELLLQPGAPDRHDEEHAPERGGDLGDQLGGPEQLLDGLSMTPSAFTSGPEASMRSAVHLMLERKIGCLPVVDDGELVGLVSETDCLRHLEHVLDIVHEKGLLPELPPAS